MTFFSKDTISKYRALIADINNKDSKDQDDDGGNMEMTWNDEDVTEEAQEELTPWEKYLEKKKAKKKKKVKTNEEQDEIPSDVDLNDPFFAEELGQDYVKSEKLKQKSKKKKQKNFDEKDDLEDSKDLGLMVLDSDDEKDHFNFKHIVEKEASDGSKTKKKKWKKKKKELEVPADDNFAVNVEDNRFSAMFNRAEYNIDPTNPSFKKTKNMDKILGEKQKRITNNLSSEEKSLVTNKKQKLDPEVSQALKSVKNKWNKNVMKKSKKLKFTVKDN